MSPGWPALSYEEWSETCDTLHAHTQVLGKLAVALAPPVALPPPVAALPADPAVPAEPAAVVFVVPAPDLALLPVPDPPEPNPLLPEALAAASWAAVSRAPQAVDTRVTANRRTTIELDRRRREPLLGWMQPCDVVRPIMRPPPDQHNYPGSG